jgi:Tfp pilus assembly protein PilO
MATNTPTTKVQPATLANIVIVSILVSFVAVVIMFIVGRVFIQQIVLKNKIITAKAKAEKQLDTNIKAVNDLATQYHDLGGKQIIIADALPDKPDFPALSSLMENIAKASKIRLQSVSSIALGSTTPTDVITTDGVQSFPFSISVSGNYSSIKTLLINLEASAQPMKVTNITVGGTSDSLSVQLSITTYYRPITGLTLKTEVIK